MEKQALENHARTAALGFSLDGKDPSRQKSGR